MSTVNPARTGDSIPDLVKSKRAFTWIWRGQMVSITGTQLSGVAFQLIAVSSLHSTVFEMGVLTAAQSFPYLFLGLFIGVIVDRSSRRRLMIISDLLRAMILATSVVLAMDNRLTIHVMWFVVVLIATFNLIFDASLGALIPEILLPDEWSSANSRLSATASGGEVAGPAIAGYIVQTFAVPLTIFLDALSYLVSAVCIAQCQTTLPQAPKPIKAEKQNVMRAVGEGLRFVVGHPILRIFGFWSAIWNFSWSAVLAVIVLFASRVLQISPYGVGLCVALGGIGGVVGASFANLLAKTFTRGRVLVYAPLLGASGAALLLLSSDHSGVLLGLGLLVFNAGQSAFGVNMQTSRQMVTPPFLMGRMDTAMRLCFTGMSSLGALSGGLWGSRFGVHSTLIFGIAGLFLAAFGILLSPLNRLVTETHKVPALPSTDFESLKNAVSL